MITSITVSELYLGVRLMPALQYSRIVADRRKAGRTIGVQDAMIVAIAKSRGAALATRNVRNFEDTGVELVNPWERN
ncbi:hypothetical protein [Bifidobacterium catulorum]|nr:hypothetical protein [Bifidobacterium catulorum]